MLELEDFVCIFDKLLLETGDHFDTVFADEEEAGPSQHSLGSEG